ncbi:MAG TPA: RNB domain-containing ribonuclease [Candidatus Binatia bacterium]|nr:RNB domain-containing ribonuclease [Candidatus Binatia bacterium]
MITDQAILRHIERQPHHSAGYKQLVREMSLRGAERQQLAERLQALVRSARLVETGRDRYTLAEHAARQSQQTQSRRLSGAPVISPQPQNKRSGAPNLIAGRLSMHRDGYGFVIPNPGQRTEVARTGRAGSSSPTAGPIAGDIFIPPPAIGSAMHGDQVLVELTRRREVPGSPAGAGLARAGVAYGRAEGRILRVLTRGNPTVVGTFHYATPPRATSARAGGRDYGTRQNYVIPMDEKITQQIVIPRGMEWPRGGETTLPRPGQKKARTGHPADEAKVASGRDRVLGREARQREWSDLENVVVEVEITEWPSPAESPRGRVLEILGYEDDFGVDVEIVIRKFHLPHQFPVEALQEAQQFEPVIAASQLRHRRDYRALPPQPAHMRREPGTPVMPIVTIDGETARDFDDAVTVSRMSNGNFELQVHIADVAHYVRPESAIDLEARLRGTSVYFPDRAVPMLPIELSTDLCSLRPQADRMVLSCVMEIDHRGEIVGYTLSEGVIRSAERMTYTNVNLILEGDAALRQHYHRLVDVFELMRELAMVLNRKRVRRGSIDFDLPEPVIEFDEHGLMQSITRSERNIANRIIEEFMLAANECVASYLENWGVASLYRIHEKPEPKRVMDFETIAARLGYSLGVGALPVKRVQFKAERRERYGTGRGATTLEIPEDVHITPRMYQKLTQKIAGKPEERILSYLMLRSLKQARYSEKNEGHFALAAPTYTHFTSPIRRYPDLIVHRILKEVLRESAEREEHGVPVGVGEVAHSETPSPWSERTGSESAGGAPDKRAGKPLAPRSPWQEASSAARLSRRKTAPAAPGGPISEDELHDIAEESSQAERRADEAERELMEWKKMKFMEERIGEDFDGLIVSVTKFGIFVELTDMFIEGLVPLSSLADDRYVYHENTRQIIGQRSRRTYSLGDPVRVLVDRIDRMQRRIQFAIVEERPSRGRGRRTRS